jgi:hypothetical protein
LSTRAVARSDDLGHDGHRALFRRASILTPTSERAEDKAGSRSDIKQKKSPASDFFFSIVRKLRF